MAGMLTDTAGEALDSVLVGAVGFGVETMSDAHGQFRLYLPSVPATGEVQLHFSRPGYRSETITYFEIPKLDIRKQLKPNSAPKE